MSIKILQNKSNQQKEEPLDLEAVYRVFPHRVLSIISIVSLDLVKRNKVTASYSFLSVASKIRQHFFYFYTSLKKAFLALPIC